MKEINYSQITQEDEHIFKLWEPLNFEIDDNYEFIKTGTIFNMFSNLLRAIIAPILYFINKILFGFEIVGRENISNVNSGKITVSNHIHPMDCTMNGLIIYPSKTYYLSLESNFKIPIVRHIIRILNAVPIPKEKSKKVKFLQDIEKALKSKSTIHIYPEGSLWPYYEELRNFKNGAFKLAVENNVPIIPIVYTFENPDRIYKIYKRKKCIKANVLEPVYPNQNLSRTDRIEDLRERTFEVMKKVILENKNIDEILKEKYTV